MGAALARGAQRHVMACVKHYACNSMENARFSVDVDGRRGDAARGLPAALQGGRRRGRRERDERLQLGERRVVRPEPRAAHRVLRDEWGFEGFVVSDFIWGLRDPAGSLAAGLDVEMPFAQQRAAALRRAGDRRRAAGGRRAGRRCGSCARQLRFAAAATGAGARPRGGASRRAPGARPRGGARGRWSCSATSRSTGVPCCRWTPGAVAARRGGPAGGRGEHRRPRLVRRARAVRRDAARGPARACPGSSSSGRGRATRRRRRGRRGRGRRGRRGRLHRRGRGRVRRLVRPGAGGALPARARRRARSTELGPASGTPDRRTSAATAPHCGCTPTTRPLISAVAAANPRTVVVVVAGAAVVIEAWRHDVPAILVAWYPGMEGGARARRRPARARASPAAGCRSRPAATRPTCRPSTGTPRAWSTTAGTGSAASTATASRRPTRSGSGSSYTTFTIGERRGPRPPTAASRSSRRHQHRGARRRARRAGVRPPPEAGGRPAERFLAGFARVEVPGRRAAAGAHRRAP